MCGGEILASSMEHEFFFHSYFSSDLTFSLYLVQRNFKPLAVDVRLSLDPHIQLYSLCDEGVEQE